MTRHGVAVAPGVAFGAAGEGLLRVCFAQSAELMERAMQRLRDGIRAEMRIMRSSCICGVCGGPARPAFRAPQPEIAPDLDMRPGEPARSTLRDWVQVCPRCGAAAPDLSALPPTAHAVVEFGRRTGR